LRNHLIVCLGSSPGELKWIVAQVESDPPLPKIKQITDAALDVLNLPYVSKKCLQQTVGLFIHPMMHRRELMSSLHCIFGWTDRLEDQQVKRLPPAVIDDLISAIALLPLAQANIKWPVSQNISATDATPTAAGGVQTTTTKEVALTLYRLAEHR
jgi:hypothetical protein